MDLASLSFRAWVSLISAGLYLSLSGAAALARRRGPLTPTLGRTTAALFAYEAFELGKQLTGEDIFNHLECAAASVVAPTTAALVITFLGEWRGLRWLVITGASYFSLLSALCLAAIFVPPLAAHFSAQPPWAIAMLAGMIPEFGFLGVLLVRHARTSTPTERARTQLLALALVLGAGGAACDLLAIAGVEDVPRVAMFGLVAAALVLAALAFQMDILATTQRLLIANVVVVIMVTVLLHGIALTLTDWPALTATLAVAITLAALGTLRPIVAVQNEERARLRQLATLGRFSAQMAHDLKNPLAAIRGAAQFLLEERARGASIDAQETFVSLIVEQTDRATRVVDDYQRLGRAEAVRRTVVLKPLLEEMRSAQQAASAAHPISLTLEPPLDASTEVSLDRDLVLGALENLIRNAREAMPDGGAITLGASRAGDQLTLRVSDAGPGMDPRTRESAFDEFFTTKATGSGLGLAFVARVAEAHGGRARLTSEVGRGTTVWLDLGPS